MARGRRSFHPDLIWHITHRCHKKEFLLKFQRDKLFWIRWMREAKRRFGLIVLNFMITSNHIHLMATLGLLGRTAERAARMAAAEAAARTARAGPGGEDPSPISMSIQLVQSRVAQRYNLRKDRRGAFWEDRFHATAIETGAQFNRCLTYVDMNMFRAGVVRHPREWPYCGYDEMERPDHRPRLHLVDMGSLLELTGARDPRALARLREDWIDAAIRKGRMGREPLWTESLAVGTSEGFLSRFQADMGSKLRQGEIIRDGEALLLRRTKRLS
jgi:putative transposase